MSQEQTHHEHQDTAAGKENIHLSSVGLILPFLALEKKLSLRAEKDDLVNRNILKGTTTIFVNEKKTYLFFLLCIIDASVAPALQASREALVKEKISESLEHRLESRPAKEDLINHGILRSKYFPSIMTILISLQMTQLHPAYKQLVMLSQRRSYKRLLSINSKGDQRSLNS